MNASVENIWYCFYVVNPHELIAITTVYVGPIGGTYGGLIVGLDGIGGIFAMFLYKRIVIRT